MDLSYSVPDSFTGDEDLDELFSDDDEDAALRTAVAYPSFDPAGVAAAVAEGEPPPRRDLASDVARLASWMGGMGLERHVASLMKAGVRSLEEVGTLAPEVVVGWADANDLTEETKGLLLQSCAQLSGGSGSVGGVRCGSGSVGGVSGGSASLPSAPPAPSAPSASAPSAPPGNLAADVAVLAAWMRGIGLQGYVASLLKIDIKSLDAVALVPSGDIAQWAESNGLSAEQRDMLLRAHAQLRQEVAPSAPSAPSAPPSQQEAKYGAGGEGEGGGGGVAPPGAASGSGLAFDVAVLAAWMRGVGLEKYVAALLKTGATSLETVSQQSSDMIAVWASETGLTAAEQQVLVAAVAKLREPTTAAEAQVRHAEGDD
jgi:hypothetical protein